MSTLKRNKLLITLSRFPYPLTKGDKLRAYYQIIELSKEYEITLFVCHHGRVKQEWIDQLSPYVSRFVLHKKSWLETLFTTIQSLFSNKPFQVLFFYSKSAQKKLDTIILQERFDIGYSQLIRSSEYLKDSHIPNLILDYMDVLSEGLNRRLSDAFWYNKLFFGTEAKRVKNYEESIAGHFDHYTIITDQDKNLLADSFKDEVSVVPNGIANHFFAPVSTEVKYDIVFVGNLSYAPNVRATEYIIEQILPLKPDLRILISGASPNKRVKDLCSQYPQVTLKDWVDDIRESYCSAKYFVAPMEIGTGLQNKLLEAMALRIPVITSHLANNALRAVDKKDVRVCYEPEDYIAAIDELEKSTIQTSEQIKCAQDFVKRNYNWSESTNILSNIFKSTK